MLISIIVPHLNQEVFLETCLSALAAQSGVVSDVEIIVVDNGSRRLPDAICSAWPNVRLTLEAIPGPGPARNRGIQEASGDILAFIDADCKADPGWLAAIEAAFSDPQTTIVGGNVKVSYRSPLRPSFVEPYESVYAYRNQKYIASGFSGTGNLAMLPSVMAAVGPFAGIAVAEDRDWGLRAGMAGYRIKYAPDMIVFHPARRTFQELTQKWDRHIAHDYESLKPGFLGALRWLGRALAVGGSSVAELPTVLFSARISGPRERALAFLCLARIRLYRSRRMIEVLTRRDGRALSAAWNRK